MANDQIGSRRRIRLPSAVLTLSSLSARWRPTTSSRTISSCRTGRPSTQASPRQRTVYGVNARLDGPDDTYDARRTSSRRCGKRRRQQSRPESSSPLPMPNSFREEINNAIRGWHTRSSRSIPTHPPAPASSLSARTIFAAGHLGGQRLVEKLKGKGNIVFYSIPGQPNLDERLARL